MKNAYRERWKKKDIIFLITALTLPIIQFILFYIIVNANSIALAFQKTTDGTHFTFNGLKNFSTVFDQIFHDESMQIMLGNTFKLYFASQIVMLFISLFLAYAFWKKVFAYKFFSAILFLPSIISNVVFVMIFRHLFTYLLPNLLNDQSIVESLNAYTQGFELTTLFYCFLSSGSMLLLLMGAMGGVDQSVVEYGRLDGCNVWQEFAHIVFPHIWPTLISLFMIGIASLFSNQGLLVTFYGETTEPMVKTIGSHIYITVWSENGSLQYPELSALGLFLSTVIIVSSLLIKRLLEKIGPKEE
ncbi:MAG: sugar ABC transporter permease [Clostridia bacterium]|nr:sugar ABC transporter permease [Clostridia bacterium]